MIRKAEGFFTRLRGLILTDGGHALLIDRCNWIHTFFMSYPLDVYYLDRQNQVLKHACLKPWRLTLPVRGATKVLEVPCRLDKEVVWREYQEFAGALKA